MAKNNRQEKAIEEIFSLPGNRENLELFYKFLKEPARGLCLCQSLPAERFKVMDFFSKDELAQRIQRIDMVHPPLNLTQFQQSIMDIYDNNSSPIKKDIFFIYNMEGSIHFLKPSAAEFFQSLNMIRDFFMHFDAVFVFFLSPSSVQVMRREAFDFYDWMGFSVSFSPEDDDTVLQPVVDGPADGMEYSEPLEKIAYYEKRLNSLTNEKARSVELLDLGRLYVQVGKYSEAEQRVTESLEIEKKYHDLRLQAERYQMLERIHRAAGEDEKALSWGLQALEILENTGVSHSREAAKLYNNLAVLYQAKKEREKALEFLSKALEIFEKIGDKDNTTVVKSNISKLEQPGKITEGEELSSFLDHIASSGAGYDFYLRKEYTVLLLRLLIDKKQSINLIGEKGTGKTRLLDDICRTGLPGIKIIRVNLKEYKGHYPNLIEKIKEQLQIKEKLPVSGPVVRLADLFQGFEEHPRHYLLLFDNYDALLDNPDLDVRYGTNFFDDLNQLKNKKNFSLLCVTCTPHRSMTVIVGDKSQGLSWLDLKLENLPELDQEQLKQEIVRQAGDKTRLWLESHPAEMKRFLGCIHQKPHPYSRLCFMVEKLNRLDSLYDPDNPGRENKLRKHLKNWNQQFEGNNKDNFFRRLHNIERKYQAYKIISGVKGPDIRGLISAWRGKSEN